MASFLQIKSNALKNLQTGTIPLASELLTLQVRSHIDRALRKYANEEELYRLIHAAGFLQGERNERDADREPINCGNKPLAYAEHYMFARLFVVALGGPSPIIRAHFYPIAMAGVLIYGIGKLVPYFAREISGRDPDMENALKTLFFFYHLGACPMSNSRPDPTSIEWGERGAREGITPLKKG